MVDRTDAPAFQVPNNYKIKEAESIKLKGGIPFHIIHAGDQPICKLELLFKGGKWHEPANGISWFANKMLSEGTLNHTSAEINKTFEQLGAFYEILPGQDLSSITFYTLNKNLEQLLPVLNEILTVPDFPDQELVTLKNIQIQTLKVNLEKNNFVASRKFREHLFGNTFPYGRNIETEDIQQIRRDNLVDFYNNQLKNNFEVLVCGDINTSVRSTLTDFFDAYPISDHFKQSTHTNGAQQHAGDYIIDKEESLQSSLRIGKKVIPKSHPDYIKLLITNELFGGYFGSRLMQKLREEKGYTYGVFSQITHYHHESYFMIAADVIKKFKDEALKDIKKEWSDIQENGVSNEELTKVKNYFKGSFLSSISNPFSLADKFKNLYYHNLDYTFYESLFSKIDNVTSADVQNILDKHLNMEDMLFVVIG